MRALNVPAAGAPIELSDLPTPAAGEGTVLVRVRAAGLNALDNGLASGMMAGMMPHENPLVLGRDAAGVVEAVGDGVSDLAVGDEVFGHVLPLIPPRTHPPQPHPHVPPVHRPPASPHTQERPCAP